MQWATFKDMSELARVRVFSGGACNIRDINGALLRNVERDHINKWLTEKEVLFYDPQIHPDTHEGKEYDFEEHHPLEIAARSHAYVNLYEVSPRTFGGATSLEIALDHYDVNKPTIIFFSDGNQRQDKIPQHTPEGYPEFVPYGIQTSQDARLAHYKEFVKNANRMRKYAMRFAQDLHALTITFNETSYEGDIAITPTRMHAADLFNAVNTAASGKRVIVNFTGGEDARDEQGNPIFQVPDNPAPVQMRLLLDQYVDEGNALRQAISDLVRINVFVRVVYTQRDVINALEDLLMLKGVLT
jgi:hypothetical protein